MHESLRKVCKKKGVKKAHHEIAGFGNLAWRKSEKEHFFSAKKDLLDACSKRSDLRESLLETLKVDAHKAFAFVKIDEFRLTRRHCMRNTQVAVAQSTRKM